MNSAATDIADILAAEGSLSLTLATNLFVGKETPTPDNTVTVFDTPGRAPQLTIGGQSDPGYYFPAVQVRVRNNDYQTGWDILNTIKTVLHGLAHEVWNGTTYELIECTGDPGLLDWDENDRARFVATFYIQRKE